MQSRGLSILIVDTPVMDANFIAGDIDNSLRKIVTLSKGFETAKSFSEEENKIKYAVSSELLVLHNKIVKHYRNQHEVTAIAFKKEYLYDQLFDNPQPLDLILAMVYSIIFTVQQTTMYDFFSGEDHELYAFGVVQANKQRLIATRK